MLFKSRSKTQYARYIKMGSTRPTRIIVKTPLNDLRSTITRSKGTPILTYLIPSSPPQMLPLRPLHNKPRYFSPNRHRKCGSTSQDSKHDSSGLKAAITDKCDCSRSNPMITDYNAKDAPAVVLQEPKHNSSG